MNLCRISAMWLERMFPMKTEMSKDSLKTENTPEITPN